MSQRRILFVDDDSMLLSGLQRGLRPMRSEWTMEFASSGAAALECMSHVPFDAVVTDMRMPEMSGAQLLEQVRLHYPQTIRFVLSGQSDRESILRTVIPAHQYLAKPCAIDELRQRLSQALALRDLLENPTLKELVSQIKTLPCMPALYHQLLEKLELPTCSVADVGLVMERDMAMTSKVLQLVNSAFFGLGHHISNPAQAVFMLGTETVKSLVLSIGIFSQFPAGNARQPDIDWLWKHGISTSRMSQKIAQLERMDKQTIDDCFAAGLLHDIGKLILMTQKGFRVGNDQRWQRRKASPLWNAEYKGAGMQPCGTGGLSARYLGPAERDCRSCGVASQSVEQPGRTTITAGRRPHGGLYSCFGGPHPTPATTGYRQRFSLALRPQGPRRTVDTRMQSRIWRS